MAWSSGAGGRPSPWTLEQSHLSRRGLGLLGDRAAGAVLSLPPIFKSPIHVNRFAASIVLVSLALVACGEDAAPLVGRWEPVEQPDSGIAGVMDLRQDGTIVRGMVVQVSFGETHPGCAWKQGEDTPM